MEAVPREKSRIEFCGGIGTGKSTVARILAAKFGLPVVEEHYRTTPFWKEFYHAPDAYEFEKNLSFLVLHAAAVREASSQPHPIQICEFALFQDLAYAAMAPAAEDFHLIEGVYRRLLQHVRSPDLLIYTRCSVNEQLARISRRNREPERVITSSYLRRLGASIDAQLRRIHIPVIDLDTEQLDFVREPETAFSALSRQIALYLTLPKQALDAP